MKQPIKDEFKGDDAHVRQSIKALIEMSDDGTLYTPLGGHARNLLATSYRRLGRNPKSALGMIAGERARQIYQGFTADHDDGHQEGDLAAAACCYAKFSSCLTKGCSVDEIMDLYVNDYPWDDESFRPGDRMDCLVKAGAFIVAEIERIQRLGEND